MTIHFARPLALAVLATSIIGGCTAVATRPTPSVVFAHPEGGTPDPATPHPAPSRGPYTTTEFWQNLAGCGDCVFNFDSLAALTKASDAVVVATIAGMRVETERFKGQNLGPGGIDINMTLKIGQTLAGTVNEFAPGEIHLDVYADASQYDLFAGGIPDERAIFFLFSEYTLANLAGQPHTPNDKMYYVIIEDQALIRDVNGSAVPVNPLDSIGSSVAGTSFAKVMSSIKAAGGS